MQKQGDKRTVPVSRFENLAYKAEEDFVAKLKEKGVI